MRYVLCAAALLCCSAVHAERIEIESFNAFRRAADDTLNVSVRLTEPMSLDFDILDVAILQPGEDGTRRLEFIIGEFGAFDANDSTVEANYFRRQWVDGTLTRLDENSLRLPVSFDRESLAFSIPRSEVHFALDDWHARVQFIENGGDAINREMLAHAPEPSSVALATFGVLALLAHRLRRRPCSR